MPDGKRKRRHSQNKAKHDWYAYSRAVRFARRFGGHRLTSNAFGRRPQLSRLNSD